MRLPSKPVWTLIGVHTLCLAVGFWFLHQLVNSLTEYQAVESRWDELALRSTRLAHHAELLNKEDLASEASAELKLDAVALEIPNSDQLGIVLVDRNFSVIRAINLPGNSPTSIILRLVPLVVVLSLPRELDRQSGIPSPKRTGS